MKILTATQMADVDRLTTELYRIPSLLLMENAGRSVADEIAKICPDYACKRILIVCGKGNNGGDGLVVARYLTLRGANPEIMLFCDPSQLKGDALANWEMVHAMGVRARILLTAAETERCLRKLESPHIIVDALFGTGLSKPVGAEFRPLVEWINRCADRAMIFSVDIPSGLYADSPAVPGIAVKAQRTVTFTALKLALVLPPAADHAGKVVVSAIGSPRALLGNPEHRLELIDPPLIRGALPPRARDSHKGSFGHLYVVAGSRGKSGAALMTGLSALRSGAGLVTLWLPKCLQRDIVGEVPELMAEFLPETKAGTSDAAGADRILEALSQADALVVGPGLSQERGTRGLIRELVRRSRIPVVLDADGINAFASKPKKLRNMEGQPVIITPHPGEMARLLGCKIPQVQKRRLETARDFALVHDCFTVLKGYQTVIAAPGGKTLINCTGNPGMATGGTGDILAGMVGRFVAAWQCRFHGADLDALLGHIAAAVHLHGLAGDLAVNEKGEESLIATDILDHLPAAFKQVCRSK